MGDVTLQEIKTFCNSLGGMPTQIQNILARHNIASIEAAVPWLQSYLEGKTKIDKFGLVNAGKLCEAIDSVTNKDNFSTTERAVSARKLSAELMQRSDAHFNWRKKNAPALKTALEEQIKASGREVTSEVANEVERLVRLIAQKAPFTPKT